MQNLPNCPKCNSEYTYELVHDPSDGHDIECKIDGFGAMKLKSSVVKKS